jgi:hypothetical protein
VPTNTRYGPAADALFPGEKPKEHRMHQSPDCEHARQQADARTRQGVAEQIERARRRAEIQRHRQLIGQAIGVFNEELLTDLQLVGFTAETIVLLELAPLIQIAWADGAVSERQRDIILEIAFRELVSEGTPAHNRLTAWLQRCPPDEIFDASLSAIHAKLDPLEPEVRGTLQREFVRACTAVALAADSVLGDHKISVEEGRVVARILLSLKPGRLAR